MNPGDTARITRGPWAGFTGRVTAVFAAGWVSVQLDAGGWVRTFAANEVEAAT